MESVRLTPAPSRSARKHKRRAHRFTKAHTKKKKKKCSSVVSKTLVARKTLWLSLQWVRGKALPPPPKKEKINKKNRDSGRYNLRLQTLCGFVNTVSAGTFKVVHPTMSKVERQTGSQDCKSLICAAVVLCFEGACL